jgi:ubiquinone/menaquinone biosynthesis C-methylase UbiE
MCESISVVFDEYRQDGKDYGDPRIAEAYDEGHARFRDFDRESEDIFAAIAVGPDHVIMDIGAGTGSFALRAARSCAKVFAVDVSQAMLDQAGKKAREAGISNIVYCHGGFLTYEHRAEPVDAIVSCTALHHLPDFWKYCALTRMRNMLKKGGKLFVADVVFDEKDTLKSISRWIEKLAAAGGPSLRKDLETHLEKEYSTFGWIMEGLLTRSGFTIVKKRIEEGALGAYLCVKE